MKKSFFKYQNNFSCRISCGSIVRQIGKLLFEVEMSTGIELSPIIKNEEQYEYWVDTLPFYRNVRDEGVVVA